MPVGVGQVARAALGRSRRGLFGGKRRLSGNKVSEDGDNKYAWLMLSNYACPLCMHTTVSVLQVAAVLESKRAEDHPIQQHIGPQCATESDYIRAQVRHAPRVGSASRKCIF